MEQSGYFLVGLWMFSLFVDPNVGGLIGAVWVVLRYLYAAAYTKSNEGLATYTIPAYFCQYAFYAGTTIKVALVAVGLV